MSITKSAPSTTAPRKSTRPDGLPLPTATELVRVLHHLPAPVMVVDVQGRVLSVNAAMQAITGYSAAELVGQRPSMLHSGLQDDDFYQRMWQAIRFDLHWSGELWNRRKDGSLFRTWLDVQAIVDAGGRVKHMVGVYRRPLEGFDPQHGAIDLLTGLLNRTKFTAAVDALRDERHVVEVVTADIEGFTQLNESLGTDTGDLLLRQVALRCTATAASTRRPHVVGRVGSDQFAIAVALPAQPQQQDVHLLGHQLRHCLAEAFDLGFKHPYPAQFSYGEAQLPSDARTAAEALVLTDAARFEGQGPASCGTVHRADQRGQERGLFTDLQAALLGNDILAVYQPQVDLLTGELVGVEALARWRRRGLQEVPPSVFIPLAERRQLILPLGERILDVALSDMAAWRAQGLRVPRLAVNFSAEQFHMPGVARHVQAALQRHGLEASCLELELTESTLIGEMDQVLHNLHELRDLGVQLAIDDFGTGYSSLAYLRRFPIDRLKIDRAFVADMHNSQSAMEIVATIVKLAHQFGLKCLAEGIETAEQWRVLREVGCDEGQGFLMARPMSPRDLGLWRCGAPPAAQG